MRALVVFFGMLLCGASATAQYDYNDEYGSSFDGPDRYFYEDNFDWRWDIRVRISDGIDNGSLTRREADRLYNKLERIERKEYAYQSDGFLSAFEQDEIWEDVVDLNRLIGIELRDWDRTYYGYSPRGLSFNGYLPWYFGSTYDFYRFDRRGYGSISFGYRPRAFFPRSHVYYRNRSYTSNWNHRNNNWNRNDNWDRDRSWNRSNNSNRDWNSSRSRTEDRNNNRNNNYSRGSRSSDNRNNSSSRDSRSNDNRSNSGNWGSGSSRSDVPSTTPQRNGNSRTEAPSTSSRGRENNRREEILTPRPSTKSSDNGSSRGNDSGRRSLPDRGKSNDSGRRGNNF
ncbi:hypothetical protein [Lacihabitans soyangensis]|uniref:DUF3300 domain-containing protein n=1 Tax=Lacihabitans soyangensis TaxID=869394 RepID=A0AAE3H4Y9_9BACT|nr:hypothetical protein [Lacihabitans soyangensis]MCP9764838.1 hypothetical protein [Lacihabitans soyangensis]